MIKDPGFVRGAWCLSREQEWLLKAASLPPEKAIEAWEKWRAVSDLEAIDYGSFQLLPAVYGNLRSRIQGPAQGILRGIYRAAWSQNQLLFNEAASGVQALLKEEIPVLLLKGAAMTLRYYRDFGSRIMGDFDILIPTEKREKALAVLEENGWRMELDIPREEILQTRHAATLRNSSGKVIDLHWHLLWCRLDSAPFWSHAEEVFWQEGVFTVPRPEYQLLHVCVHGARCGDEYEFHPHRHPLLWALDALKIFEVSPDFRWDHFEEAAGKLYVRLQMGHTLHYLKDAFQAAVPRGAVQQLLKKPASRMERFHYAATMQPDGPKGLKKIRFLICRLFTWIYKREGAETLSCLRGHQLAARFIIFLKERFELEHLWQVPFRILSKVIRRPWTLWS